MTSMFLPAVLGLSTGLTLIVAIGAQNACLLRLGVTARASVLVCAVVICAGSDAVLILAGVLGTGAVIAAAPWALTLIRWAGAGFLLLYAAGAARRALRPVGMDVSGPGEGAAGAGPDPHPARALFTLLALTWLNPHVYLDTVVLLGSIANAQETGRWWWAAGAAAASWIWFAGLAFGARALRPVFARPGAWRVLDAGVALVMAVIGLRIAVGL